MTETATTQRSERETADGLFQVLPDLARMKTAIVNLYFLGDPTPGSPWVLIDTGLPPYASSINAAAEKRFGPHARPTAILLTHGHFDHIGNLKQLLGRWDVPVYAHRLELPYLTGRSDYPPPDASVGGGMLSRTAKLFPWSSIDIRNHVQALPDDGHVPGAPGWRWIHTPGHTPGHVSFLRDSDRALIAGDAFITTKQESLFSVLTQLKIIHGPPTYFTTDWDAARDSVRNLAILHPSVAATGHGVSMYQPELDEELTWLADNFERVAVPRDGRYVRQPARANENGVTFIPPARFDPVPWIAGGALALGATALALSAQRRKSTNVFTRALRRAASPFS